MLRTLGRFGAPHGGIVGLLGNSGHGDAAGFRVGDVPPYTVLSMGTVIGGTTVLLQDCYEKGEHPHLRLFGLGGGAKGLGLRTWVEGPQTSESENLSHDPHLSTPSTPPPPPPPPLIQTTKLSAP